MHAIGALRVEFQTPCQGETCPGIAMMIKQISRALVERTYCLC